MDNRWYDKYDTLKKNLESFRDVDTKSQDELVKGVMTIIRERNPELLSFQQTVEFPLDAKRRRWYDGDPDLWLMINTLQSADEETIKEVDRFLEEALAS